MRVPEATKEPLPFLPMTRAEVDVLGWDAPDVLFITGDAYVDHPSFAMAILGRVLESAGFKVAILSQPDWSKPESFLALGRPRLFAAVSAGNMDSMLNRFTAQKKLRSDDAYSPGGVAGRRPDRSTNVYVQRCREVLKGVPVIAGGVEASLRRFAHYDYWSDTVRPSILASSKADLVVFGMGEAPIVEIARRLDAGENVRDLRDMRGVSFLLGAKEELPASRHETFELPSFEAVRDDKRSFATATRHIHKESNPFNARRLTQLHGGRRMVQNPPDLPLSQPEMDAIYDLPYGRAPHPSYDQPIPAFDMMKTSVTIMRGCFGGCTFCSITTHQGRVIQSRSKKSIVREIESFEGQEGYKGNVSDIGGPTANMYEMRCTKPEVEKTCRRLSCVHPTICPLLGTDHAPLVDLMKAAREAKGAKRVHVASGVRMDLAKRSPEYLRDLAAHHVGGHLKVAPEHVDDEVLKLMKKPGKDDFEEFGAAFKEASAAVGKEQYLVPYFIASHPGSTLDSMIDLALFLKRNGYKPRQVQDFIPAPLDVATCMYYTGLDPMTMKPVPVAKGLNDRRLQRSLLQFFKPENWYRVRDALEKAGRLDLVGDGCDALIPTSPPKEAVEARRARARREWDSFTGFRDEETPKDRSVGYRPGRSGF